MAAISTVWFGVGGFLDLFRLFRDLEARIDDPLDNGSVEGHVSLADVAKFKKLEQQQDETDPPETPPDQP